MCITQSKSVSLPDQKTLCESANSSCRHVEVKIGRSKWEQRAAVAVQTEEEPPKLFIYTQPFIGQVILLDKVKKMIVKQEKDDAVVKIVAENGAKITMKVTGKEGLQWVSALLRRNFYMVGHYTHNDNRKTTPSKTPNMFLGLQDKTDGTVLTGSRLDNLVPVDGSGKKGSEDRRGFKTARDVGSRRKLAKTYSDQSNDRNTLATTQTFEMDPSHFDNGANLAGKSGSDTDLFHTKNTQTLTNDLETAQGSAEREGRKKDRDGTPANASTPANAD